MLKKANRLTREQDIRRVLRDGRRISTPFYQAVVLLYKTSHIARGAAVVSRRVHVSAVQRHLLQRRLRALMKECMAEYPSGYDMVIVARPGAAHQSLQKLRLAAIPLKAIFK